MHATIPPRLLVIIALALTVWSCRDEPRLGAPPKPDAVTPTERELDPEAEEPEGFDEPWGAGVPSSTPEDPWAEFDDQSPYRHPESLMKPMDGFPLPRGAVLVSQDRDLAVYEVSTDVKKVEAFYRERDFHITKPGKLPGFIATRTDAGTKLQAQPGKHRLVTLRFYR